MDLDHDDALLAAARRHTERVIDILDDLAAIEGSTEREVAGAVEGHRVLQVALDDPNVTPTDLMAAWLLAMTLAVGPAKAAVMLAKLSPDWPLRNEPEP